MFCFACMKELACACFPQCCSLSFINFRFIGFPVHWHHQVDWKFNLCCCLDPPILLKKRKSLRPEVFRQLWHRIGYPVQNRPYVVRSRTFPASSYARKPAGLFRSQQARVVLRVARRESETNLFWMVHGNKIPANLPFFCFSICPQSGFCFAHFPLWGFCNVSSFLTKRRSYPWPLWRFNTGKNALVNL